MPETEKKQICTMRIMFPVDSDEKAIEYKKKLSVIIADIPDINIHFTISDMPISPFTDLLKKPNA